MRTLPCPPLAGHPMPLPSNITGYANHLLSHGGETSHLCGFFTETNYKNSNIHQGGKNADKQHLTKHVRRCEETPPGDPKNPSLVAHHILWKSNMTLKTPDVCWNHHPDLDLWG